tara:strand:+ start:639 stop:773 length:135 start_codon:yes stop_codon:yes gene_type:complete
MQDVGDAFLMDMDLFMDMDMHGAGDLFQPNLEFFNGSFQAYDAR